jgi:hypothetical protein
MQPRGPQRDRETSRVVAAAFAARPAAAACAAVATVDAARSRSDSRDPFAGVESALTRYLLALSRLCVEVARRPHLLPWFLAILAKVPSTLLALRRARRIAA